LSSSIHGDRVETLKMFAAAGAWWAVFKTNQWYKCAFLELLIFYKHPDIYAFSVNAMHALLCFDIN